MAKQKKKVNCEKKKCFNFQVQFESQVIYFLSSKVASLSDCISISKQMYYFLS